MTRIKGSIQIRRLKGTISRSVLTANKPMCASFLVLGLTSDSVFSQCLFVKNDMRMFFLTPEGKRLIWVLSFYTGEYWSNNRKISDTLL